MSKVQVTWDVGLVSFICQSDVHVAIVHSDVHMSPVQSR